MIYNPTTASMEVPREDAKQVRVQVATEDARGLWDIALVREGGQVHVRTIYRAHGGTAASNAHTADWTGEDVVRVCVEVSPEVGGGFGVGLQLTLEPEPIASFAEWVEGGQPVAVSRNAGETDDELRGRLLRARAAVTALALSEAGKGADDANKRERITIDQARQAMGLGPLREPYGDMTLGEFNDRYNKLETDDELKARLLMALHGGRAERSAGSWSVLDTAAGEELDRVAAKHGLYRKKAAAPLLTPAPARPPTREELVGAEREAGELLGELDEFGCSEVVESKAKTYACTDVEITVQNGRGDELTIPLVDIVAKDIQFASSVVNPVIKVPCPECGEMRIEGNPMCHVCAGGLP